jgi:3-oxoacyl-[acyl-carrier protein] reductase
VEFTNKVCLIAGASGAIGSAVAKAFYNEGARVALTYHAKRTCALSIGLPSEDSRIATFRLDVRKWKDVQAVVAQAEGKFGPIDILVNCTGALGPVGPTQEVSVEHWIQTIQINLLGGFLLARAVLPSMLATGAGKIIQFSGGGAAYGRPFFTAYSASKAALVRLTESLAAEVAGKNIQVNAIAPGPVKSRMWDELLASGPAGGPQALAELKKMEETGGVPAERAAALAMFLASSRSDGLTGRLISAVYDKWETLGPDISNALSRDAGTLRRVPLE